METISERVRKVTTVFLAAFLWFHALFFFNFQSAFLSKCTQLLRLTTSEVIVFSLLVIFSFAAGSGFWKPFRSVAYIYAFPFVLLMYFFYACFLMLRAMHRWFKKQADPQLGGTSLIVQKESATVGAVPTSADKRDRAKARAAEVLSFMARPFRRFTFLWCILLLVTTHIIVVWSCLMIVMCHLARIVFRILKVLFFSDPWLKKVGTALRGGIDVALAGIAIVTPDTDPTQEMKNWFNQLNLWKKLTAFLSDSYLLSRWAWVAGILFFGFLYVYIAVLFSFAYYGIARVSGVPYSWPAAVVTSLFIPFFVSELPKVLVLQFLGGLHCLLVVGVGIGTLVNLIQRRVRSIHAAAMDISARLTDKSISDKFLILEAKLTTTSNSAPPTEGSKG